MNMEWARDCRGYTLLEMLVVLGLLTMIMSLSLTTHPLGSRRGLESISTEIATLLQSAKIRAISQNAERTIIIDPVTRTLSTGSLDEPVTLGADVGIAVLTAHREVKEGRAVIRFYPDGSTTGGTVQLKRGARIVSIHLNWLTGQIRREGGVAR
jgi:general secretion pathway protein H